jgi:hypothetical protein
LLIGAWGGFRIAEVAYSFSAGDNPVELRDYLENWWQTNKTIENDTGFLIASSSGLWYLNSDFSLTRSREPYGAGGAGAPTALGALHALHNLKLSKLTGEQKVRAALKACEKHTSAARPPMKVVSL